MATLLNVSPTDPVNQSNFDTISSLDLSGTGLNDTDLDELESITFSNLLIINLSENNITRLINFESFPRTIQLNLKNNNINGDVILDSINSLTHLYLSDNNINSIEINGDISKLNTLYLDDNAISQFPKFNVPIVSLAWIDLTNNNLSGTVTLDNTVFIKPVRLYMNSNNIEILDLNNVVIPTLSVYNNQLKEIKNVTPNYQNGQSNFMFGIDLDDNQLISIPAEVMMLDREERGTSNPKTPLYYGYQERVLDEKTITVGENTRVYLPIYNQLLNIMNDSVDTEILVNGVTSGLVVNIDDDYIDIDTELLPIGLYSLELQINGGYGNGGYTYTLPLNITDIVTEFSVTYNGNGNTSGNVPIDTNSPYNQDSEVSVLAKGTLEKAGYSFKGWNTQPDGNGTMYQPETTFIIHEDIVLYAIWEENVLTNTYTVTYNGNGNTSGNVPIDTNSPYNQDSEVSVLAKGTLEKAGYSFKGWNTQPDGNGTMYQPETSFIIHEDIVLYAIWEENNIIVPEEKPTLPSTGIDQASALYIGVILSGLGLVITSLRKKTYTK